MPLDTTSVDSDDPTYERVIEDFRSLPDPQLEAYYQREIFPRSCQRIRDSRPGTQDQLLFVPVGTQAYAPILAILANPCHRAVLLHSRESRAHSDLVCSSLASEDVRLQPMLIDPYDIANVAQIVRNAYEVCGQPERVVCDQTGGTKITTTALSGLAALNGWRLTYIKAGSQNSHKNYWFREVAVDLPNPFFTVGGWHRVLARHLAAHGRFGAAVKATREARKFCLASAAYARQEKLFQLARAYREADFPRVLSRAAKQAASQGRALPAGTVEAMAASHPDAPPPELIFWVARCHFKEGSPLACEALLHRVQAGPQGRGLAQQLDELRNRLGTGLKIWKPLDDFIGLGLSRSLARDVPR